MKTVFPTRQVAHVWAQGTQHEGRNSASSLYFRGNTLYSYRDSAPIAKLIEKDGVRAVLWTLSRWSSTSDKHLSYAKSASSHLLHFSVPTIECTHETALQGYKDRLAETWLKSSRARTNGLRYLQEVQYLVDEANAYLAWFDLKHEPFKSIITKAMLDEIRKADIQHNTEKRKIQKIANEKFALEVEAKAVEWIAGERDHFPAGSSGKVYMRIEDDEVVTSLGARFPVRHARRVFPHIEACRTNEKAWHRNGKTLPVGHFQIDSIDTNGTVKAGCHTIEFDEIARIYGLIGEEVEV